MLPVPSSSGERFLSSLLDFIDRRAPDLLAGRASIKIQPRALEYLSIRLQSLDELQSLKASAPVDYLRGCAANLQDFKRLERLQQVLHHAKHLRVTSLVPHLRDPTRVNLTQFRSLTTLELRGCDLSTCAWAGLEVVRGQLTSLHCYDSLEELDHLLAPYVRFASTAGGGGWDAWPQLKQLSCSSNSFTAMDESLTLLPAVETLDLSNNNLQELQNLHACHALTELDLSNNSIACVEAISQCTGRLRKVVLQGNALKTTKGLEALTDLQELDLRCNILASMQDVVRLAGLPHLRELLLAGNPLSYARTYRVEVFACFPEALSLVLDGCSVRKAERKAVMQQRALVHDSGSVAPSSGEHLLLHYVEQAAHLLHPELSTPLMGEDSVSSEERWQDGPRPHGPGTAARSERGRCRRRVVDFHGSRELSPAAPYRHPVRLTAASPSGSLGQRGSAPRPAERRRSGPGEELSRSASRSLPRSAFRRPAVQRLLSGAPSDSLGRPAPTRSHVSPPRFERAVLERFHQGSPSVARSPALPQSVPGLPAIPFRGSSVASTYSSEAPSSADSSPRAERHSSCLASAASSGPLAFGSLGVGGVLTT
ncbi:hypothetical protein WJX72_001616 [[Myrmecia] bisecta]|uniref:Uncharacterized protein n=1 Tax=[Myrmecia] bisecta TaxID=41462 RepID=A0AAW1QP19_9CHLO